MINDLNTRLRDAVQQLRRTSMPLADVIPMLQQAADRITELESRPAAPVVAEGLQAKLDRAERALIRAGFDDLGGQEWKPPLGKPPVFIEVHSKIEAAIPSLYGMWHKQLIANGAVMHEKLIPALRQFCHNDGSEGYVHAYDMEIVNREFSAMEAKMARQEGVNVFAELLGKLLSAKGLPRLTDEHIETWAWRTLTELFSQQEMKTAIRCEECAGTGKCGPDENPSEMDCEVCDGSGQVTAHQLTPASIDTPEFQRLLDDFAGTAIDAHACGNDCGTGAKRDAAETALIGYIDGRAAAEPMPASEAANLKKLCDQLDGMKRTMFLMPGTGQHYSYLLLEDVSAYVEEARKSLAAHPVAGSPVPVPGLGSLTNEDDGVLTLRFKDEDAAQAFMHSHSPTVDCRDMPDVAGSPAEASGHDDNAEWTRKMQREAEPMPASEAPTDAKPTMVCQQCGVDRFKVPCPGMADECAMIADAHLQSVRDAAMDEAVQILVAQQGWSDDDKPTVEMCVKLILISKHNPGLLPPSMRDTAQPTIAVEEVRDALEEAAAICDDLHRNWRWDDAPDSDSGPRSCARAIRAIASTTTTKG